VTNGAWRAAKLTAIGIGLVVASALVTGVVVAKRLGHESLEQSVTPAAVVRSASSQPTPNASGASGGKPDPPCTWSPHEDSPSCSAP
jgi:hypothetical protein